MNADRPGDERYRSVGGVPAAVAKPSFELTGECKCRATVGLELAVDFVESNQAVARICNRPGQGAGGDRFGAG
jgi:hypothetical protein